MKSEGLGTLLDHGWRFQMGIRTLSLPEVLSSTAPVILA